MDHPIPESAGAPLVVDRARALGPMIAAAADRIEAERRLPPELVARLHAAKLCRLVLPRRSGGEEVTPAEYLRTLIEVARHDASTAWIVFITNSAALIAAWLPEPTAATIFADPRATIAWGPPNACIADAVPGGYRLTGRFDFASGCRIATWMGAHVRVREADGSFRLNQHGKPAFRTLVFPADQARLLDVWNPIGLRGTASDSYEVEDIFVPEAFSATREQPEARREQGPLYAFTQQGIYAVGSAGVAIGIAEAMIDAFADLATRKTPRGAALLADDPLMQAELARARAALSAATAWLSGMLAELYARAGHGGAPFGLEDRAMLRLAAVNAIHAAIGVADRMHKAAGVDAIFPGSPFERRFRDMHTLSQQIQARDSHYVAVGQALLGRAPPTFL
jgi:indole-3-acetate monooxygenase